MHIYNKCVWVIGLYVLKLMYAYLCVSLSVCVFTCVCVFVFVCMCVCVCVYLESEESEDHEAEDGEGHHLGQLLHRVQQCVDDCLQALTTNFGLAETLTVMDTRLMSILPGYHACQPV